jgi:soluble lytic murein transglycosylase
LLEEDQLGPEQRRDARRGLAGCLFRSRRYAEAAGACDRILREDASDHDAAILRARANARAGLHRLSIRQLQTVIRKAPARERVRAQYLAALLTERADPEASRTLLRAVEKQRTSADLAGRARWALAWSDLTARRFDAAIRRLTPLARGSQWDVTVQRARYWIAVAKLALKNQEGRAELDRLADTLPLTYYGLMAADKIGGDPQAERSILKEAIRQPSHASVDRASWLLQAEFGESARDELESWIGNGASLSRSDRLAAARLLHQMGDHFRAVRILVDGFGGALEQGIDREWREAWRMAWPLPFNTSVRQAAKEFELDPAFVYAVMREESTYRPQVTSRSGAIGLMQIIPPTADRIARALGIRAFDPEVLFDPRTNIRFGTYYLKDLTERFAGSSPLAIAAYNAGPDAVKRWRARDGALAPDAFVESVPYGETRRYLRRVLRSRHVYRLLYSELRGAQPRARLLR